MSAYSSIYAMGRRRPSKSTLILLIAIAFVSHVSRDVSSSSAIFVSAQNVAGKVATRAKLEEQGSKKKRRFWGGTRNEEVDAVATSDGEYSSFGGVIWKRRKRVVGVNRGDETSWKWDLFLAESRMIFMSVIMSGLCAILSFIW